MYPPWNSRQSWDPAPGWTTRGSYHTETNTLAADIILDDRWIDPTSSNVQYKKDMKKGTIWEFKNQRSVPLSSKASWAVVC